MAITCIAVNIGSRKVRERRALRAGGAGGGQGGAPDETATIATSLQGGFGPMQQERAPPATKKSSSDPSRKLFSPLSNGSATLVASSSAVAWTSNPVAAEDKRKTGAAGVPCQEEAPPEGWRSLQVALSRQL